MNHPTFEAMESRLLLSAGVLSAGQAAMFDLDGNGTDDAILVNTGDSDIEYGYTAGEGLDYVNVTADGASFVTNTWVGWVDDNSADDDFHIASARFGTGLRYGGVEFDAIAGGTSVQAGSAGKIQIGEGDLLYAGTLEAGITKLRLKGGDLYDVYSAGDMGAILVCGDILGDVYVAGDLGTVSADRIDGGSIIADGDAGRLCFDQITGGAYLQGQTIDKLAAETIDGGSMVLTIGDMGKLYAGTIQTADIIVGGDMNKLRADTLSGSEDGTTVAIAGHLNELRASTLTGGVNGILSVSIGAGLDKLIVGLMEGGQAVDGGYAGTDFSVAGDVQCLQAGLISGGQSTGSGSFAMLSLNIDGLWGDDGSMLAAGDLQKLRAAAISGGDAADYGEAMLFINIANDLIDARAGQIIGSGLNEVISDPSVFLTVGHNIVKLVAGEISAGTATGDGAYASVWIDAGYDIEQLVAGRIDAGTADGDYATVEVWINAGHDIGMITADTFSGGISTGEGGMAGVYVNAGRNIEMIGARLISGTQARRWIADPTVQFIAGGDIGCVLAGQITGGSVTSNGELLAEASVRIEALGEYVDGDGTQSEGNINAIYAGTIRGGTATGADSLAHVDIRAAHDIKKICADTISGGQTNDGGYAYVDILAEHDIVELWAGTILGSENGSQGCDPAVQIQAFNDIQLLVADRIIAGEDGTVNILAGLDADGNVSGELDENGELVAGSIENLIVGTISGAGGVVNIAAGGDIENLKACRIVSGDGEVNVVAGGDMDVNVRRVRSWSVQDESGVEFSAGGDVNDIRNSIRDEYVTEGEPVDFPEPLDF